MVLSGHALRYETMKPKLLSGIGALFVALLIASAVFVPAVSASTNEERYGPVEPEPAEFVDVHPTPSLEERNYIIVAIESSNLSEDEKDALLIDLEQIWSSDLSGPERNIILSQLAPIVFSYYNIDSNSNPTPSWSGYVRYYSDVGTHNLLAEIAGQNMGLSSWKCRILNEQSAVPDDWGLLQMPTHYSWGGAGSKAKDYANQAKVLLSEDPEDPEGYEKLSWAMHFMSDVANPWHTQQLWAQGNHVTYEQDYVLDEMVDGHNFKQVLVDSPSYWWYRVTDPEASASNLAALSSGYFYYVDDKINHDSDWKNDSTVVEYTKDVLEEALHYNMGLVKYVGAY
jgi:hypothetical protein